MTTGTVYVKKVGNLIYHDKISGLDVYGRNVYTGYNNQISDQYLLNFYDTKSSNKEVANFEIKSYTDLHVNLTRFPSRNEPENIKNCVKCLETLVRFGHYQNVRENLHRYRQVIITLIIIQNS